MNNIPVYPEYKTLVMYDDSYSFMTNTVAVRLETRVPHEIWEEFKEKLGISDALLAGEQKGLTDGR